MVKVKDIEKVMDDYMIEPDDKFFEIKRYLISEFDWNVNPLKESQFMIRGIPIKDDMKLSEILKSYLPEEVVTLKEI